MSSLHEGVQRGTDHAALPGGAMVGRENCIGIQYTEPRKVTAHVGPWLSFMCYIPFLILLLLNLNNSSLPATVSCCWP